MLKRLTDIFASLLGLLLISPLFIFISVAIIIDTGFPVFYKQSRVGINGKHFRLFKFRSMRTDLKGLKITLNEDPRITKSGKWLRKFKLDELPQLINILKGDMSLVGPRPEVQKYVDHYSEAQMQVLSVKPGLTGLDSLHFSHENELLEGKENPEDFYISDIMPAKLELSLEYIRKRSFWFDFKLVLQTIRKVFF